MELGKGWLFLIGYRAEILFYLPFFELGMDYPFCILENCFSITLLN